MTAHIEHEIEKLVELIREEAPSNATSFELFINSESYEVKYGYHNAKELKDNGISMRNLKREWVK